MKQYLLFAGYSYYPYGGALDFQGDFDTLEKCKEKFELLRKSTPKYPDYNRWNVIDIKNNIPIVGIIDEFYKLNP